MELEVPTSTFTPALDRMDLTSSPLVLIDNSPGFPVDDASCSQPEYDLAFDSTTSNRPLDLTPTATT